MNRALAYTLAGGALSLGAPLGLLGLRAGAAARASPEWLSQELARDGLTYGYVTVATLLAFAAFGHALGRRADALYSLSATDPLTGLANRRTFERRLAHEYARARRYHTPLSLLIADLDGLKFINDSHGHRAGDAALESVARAIAGGLRRADLGARWGGDEFAVLAPSTGAADAGHLAERIRALAEEPRGSAPSVTVSLGIASLGAGDTLPLEDLLRAADGALYEAKRLGRNRVVGP